MPHDTGSEWIEYARQQRALPPERRNQWPVPQEPLMSTARKMWIGNCVLWGGVWTIVGVIVWPALIFALLSFLLILWPVGVRQ